MRKLFLAILLTVTSITVLAIPAKRVTRTFNINGQSVQLTLTGDENLHYWQAADGSAYQLTDDNTVVPIDLAKAISKTKRKSTPQLRSASTETTTGMRRISEQNRIKYTGERHGLVILAAFKDKKFSITNTRATYQDAMSKVNYSGNGQFGSVRDYFYAQSYGQFDFELDVVGPVTLSNNMAYYGANNSLGDDVRPGEMVKEACELVDDEVDFSKYDWDGDGWVENIFVVYAGYGEAQGGAANTIWPHAWDIYSATDSWLNVDGVVVNTYACGSELSGSSGKKMDGIGTICHEFSHCFGLPDFYCTNYGHNELTMSYWSIMDVGSYSNNGYCPTAYTAYERWFCGWLEPKELNSPAEITDMKDIESEGDCYVLYNQGNKNEYYLMYNVQANGWNTYAPGHGMLVLHVDYSRSAWDENTPNNTASHLRMTPICADNNRTTTTYSLQGDPYPGRTKNTSLTDTSSPAATLFNANKDGRKYMGHPIENIEEKDNLISFIFDGGSVPAIPTNLVCEQMDDSFTLSWDKAENADSYNVEYGVFLKDAVAPVALVDEKFPNATSDSSTDISGKLNDYTNLKGFTGSKIYAGKKGFKIGSSSTKGYIITPELDFGNEEEITVTMVAANYNASVTTITVYALDADNNELSSSQVKLSSIDLKNEQVKVNVAGAAKLKIYGNMRFYLSELKVGGIAPNPYSDTVTLTNIKETTITVTPTTKASTYYYRVQSVNKFKRIGEWTEIRYIDFIDTAIKDVQKNKSHNTIYTISGYPVKHTNENGVYIINGKKCVVK